MSRGLDYCEMKIPKWWWKAVNPRTENTMVKRKRRKEDVPQNPTKVKIQTRNRGWTPDKYVVPVLLVTHVVLSHSMINRERGKKDGIVSSSNGTFISVPQIFRTDYHNQVIMSKVVVLRLKLRLLKWWLVKL